MNANCWISFFEKHLYKISLQLELHSLYRYKVEWLHQTVFFLCSTHAQGHDLCYHNKKPANSEPDSRTNVCTIIYKNKKRSLEASTCCRWQYRAKSSKKKTHPKISQNVNCLSWFMIGSLVTGESVRSKARGNVNNWRFHWLLQLW